MKDQIGKGSSETYIDPVVVKLIMDASCEVLGVQMKTDVKFTTIQPLQSMTGGSGTLYDIASVIGLVGNELIGSLAIGFPSATFLKVANRMMRETFTKIDKENADTAGEILNIISGVVRRNGRNHGYTFSSAIPNVIVGKEFELAPGVDHSGLIKLRADTDVGPFFLEFTMKKRPSEGD